MTAGSFFLSYLPDEDILLLAQASPDGHDVWNELYQRFGAWITRVAGRIASDLPPDLLDDVVQEVMVALIRSKTPFCRERGSPKAYLRGLVRNAVRKVRKLYARPLPSDARAVGAAREPALSLDAPAAAGDKLADTLRDSEDPLRVAMDRMIAQQVLVAASRSNMPDIVEAVRLIYRADIAFSAVATSLGVNRTTLSRRLRMWARTAVGLNA